MYNNDLLLYICHLIEDQGLGVILSRVETGIFPLGISPNRKLSLLTQIGGIRQKSHLWQRMN